MRRQQSISGAVDRSATEDRELNPPPRRRGQILLRRTDPSGSRNGGSCAPREERSGQTEQVRSFTCRPMAQQNLRSACRELERCREKQAAEEKKAARLDQEAGRKERSTEQTRSTSLRGLT